MQKILCSLFVLLVCACPVWAGDKADQSPKRGWILQYRAGWNAICPEDGLKLPVPANAVIRDCGGVPGTLDKYMNMDLKAIVHFTNATDKDGGLHVQEVQVLCE